MFIFASLSYRSNSNCSLATGAFSHDEFIEPIAVAVNRDGDVLVADNGVGAIMVFESSGKLKKKIGRKGAQRGQFKEMSSLCIGEEGEIIVADTRILIFSAGGEFVKELGGGKEAGARGRYSGVALDSKSGLLLAAKMEKTRSYIQVDRVLSFFSCRLNWDSPTPSPAGECVPSLLWFRRVYTLACERGGGGIPIPTRGQTLWYSRYRYIYMCVRWE
jgi:hypothetical protein